MNRIEPKAILIAIAAVVAFGLFLVWTGKISIVTDALKTVVPTSAPAKTIAIDVPSIANPLKDLGLLDPKTLLPVPDKVVSTLDSIPSDGGKTAAGYDRAAYGTPWKDVDHTGCDTRDRILARDLTSVTYRPGTNDCVVVTGTLVDPYTATTIQFTKTKATAIQIDHMVPLSWAWQEGASTWPESEREKFANDLANLTAVQGAANEAKSDKGPSQWLPSNQAYRCEYVTRFVYIVSAYKLSIDDADRAAARRELASCS